MNVQKSAESQLHNGVHLKRPESRVSRRGLGLVVAVELIAILGCAQNPNESKNKPDPSQTLVVCAVAASTKDALQEAAAALTPNSGIEIKLNADDSSKLAAQITNDAPADLFLSANEKWAEFVRDKGFAAESTPLLGNRLVIVVPKENPAGVAKPDDLTKPGVRRVAVAGPTVPAGIYARQALTRLNLWDELAQEKKIVAGENVRVTLTYVERGEAEAGVVYATDAGISKAVEAVYTFESRLHDPIIYPLVLLKAGEKNEGARKFYEYLQAPAASEIFQKYGFTRLGGK
jgi:molybdate transport system substrate-binding protein